MTTKLKTVSVRLPSIIARRLDRFARGQAGERANRSAVIIRAISDYLDWRVPQQADLAHAIAQADRGEVVDHTQVEKWMAREQRRLRRRIRR